MNGKGICFNHSVRQMLYDYSLGHLNEAEERKVEEHLLACDACHDLLTERARFSAWLQRHPETIPLPVQSEAPLPRLAHLWSWHKGAVLAVAAFVALALPASLLSYLASIQTARYGLELPAVDALKSLDGENQTFHSGVTAFQQRDYQSALRHFTSYLKHMPDNFDANFFSGLCCLELSKQKWVGVPVRLDREMALKGIGLLERARKIASSLQQKTGNARYYADSTYYLGKAYYMLGQPAQAKEYFRLYLAVDEPILAHRDEVRSLLKSMP